MNYLNVQVINKIARYLLRDGNLVCGNSDYIIKFAFDSEWDTHNEKTARFIWNGKYQDVDFTGTECPVPIVSGTTELLIGVYAGGLSTTTPANIPCLRSILCGANTPSEENDKYYANKAKEEADRAEAAADSLSMINLEGVKQLEGRVTNAEIEVEQAVSIAKGATQSVAVADYPALFELLSNADADKFRVGQNIYIAKLNVPDVWISAVEPDQTTQESYTSDAAFIAFVNLYGSISIGHYSVSFLETQKVDLSEYFKRTEVQSLVNTALTNAKENGEFDGTDGYNPIRGTDYWTEADKAEIKAYVDDAILGGVW